MMNADQWDEVIGIVGVLGLVLLVYLVAGGWVM